MLCYLSEHMITIRIIIIIVIIIFIITVLFYKEVFTTKTGPDDVLGVILEDVFNEDPYLKFRCHKTLCYHSVLFYKASSDQHSRFTSVSVLAWFGRSLIMFLYV